MNYHPTEEKDLEMQRMAPQRGEELCELKTNCPRKRTCGWR